MMHKSHIFSLGLSLQQQERFRLRHRFSSCDRDNDTHPITSKQGIPHGSLLATGITILIPHPITSKQGIPPGLPGSSGAPWRSPREGSPENCGMLATTCSLWKEIERLLFLFQLQPYIHACAKICSFVHRRGVAKGLRLEA
jgi:hypothetical protein